MINRQYTLLLACDDYVYFNGDNYYAANKERWDFYHRYLRVFNRVKLVCRCIMTDIIRAEFVELPKDTITVVHIEEFHGPLEYAKSYFRIGQQLKDVVDDVDASIIRLPSTIAERVGGIVKGCGIPYSTEVVYNVNESYKATKNPFYRLLEFIIDKRVKNLCYGAQGVSCVTEFELQKHYFSKIPGAFKSYYSSLSIDKSFYSGSRRFPNKQTLMIAHVANEVTLESRKGHKMIIDMLTQLNKEDVVVNVSFAGKDYNGGVKGIQEYAKSKGVEKQVFFPGYLSRQALRAFLEESDLFVFPTRAEGLPRVLIEAMALGLPCVASDISGNKELLDDSYLFNITDLGEMTNKVKTIISDREAYEMASLTNFNKSLEYEGSILEKRRDSFYIELKRRCN